MMTLGGQPIAYIAPGPAPVEVECMIDLIVGLFEDGLDAAEIKVVLRRLINEPYGRHWESIWCSGPRQRRPVQLETACAVLGRLSGVLMGVCDAFGGEDGGSAADSGERS